MRFEPQAQQELPAESESSPMVGDAVLSFPPPPWFAARSRALRAPLWLQRLVIAAAQSLLLGALFYTPGHWRPGNGIIAGLMVALLLAPLLLIQGLGRIATRPLLTWAGGAAVYLFGLGLYLHWRAGGETTAPDHATIMMAGIVLFIGQSLLLAQGGRRTSPYPALYHASWGLLIQLLFCGLCAVALWMIWHAFPVKGLIALAAAIFAAAFISQSLDRAALQQIEPSLRFVLGASLPAAILISMLGILSWSLIRWLPPFALSAAASLLMITAINASYGDGGWRPQWRRRLEFGGAILLLPLATLAAMALHARVDAFGFTANRVTALALLLLLSAYALVYIGAALISLGGGRAMERLETGNQVMAFVVAAVLLAMTTPLADPVRLAVAEQSWRLAHGAVAPARFDYPWLRNSGLRFGQEALRRLAAPSLKFPLTP